MDRRQGVGGGRGPEKERGGERVKEEPSFTHHDMAQDQSQRKRFNVAVCEVGSY